MEPGIGVATELPQDVVPLSMAGATSLPDGSGSGSLVKVCLRVYLSFSGKIIVRSDDDDWLAGYFHSFVYTCLRHTLPAFSLLLPFSHESSVCAGERQANNVSLVVNAPSFLHVVPKNVIIQKVGGMQSTPVMVKLYFYATKTNLPSGRI